MRKAIILTAALLLVAVGCAPAAPRPLEVVREMPVKKVVEAERAAWEASQVPGAPYGGLEAAVPAPVSERMIIRTVELAMYVQDVEASFDRIQALAEEMGGYVVSANTWHQGEYLRARLTIRVPAKGLDGALEQIKVLATEVERESSSGEDVTEEYTDLEARLRNLEATEKELLELLKTVRQRSSKAEDILAVYRELTSIRSEIERLKGRMQYLEKMSAMATIHIELTPDVLSRPLTVGRWEPKGTAANAIRTLIKVLQFLVNAGIWVAIVGLPILILVAIPVFVLVLIIRAWRRKRRRQSGQV